MYCRYPKKPDEMVSTVFRVQHNLYVCIVCSIELYWCYRMKSTHLFCTLVSYRSYAFNQRQNVYLPLLQIELYVAFVDMADTGYNIGNSLYFFVAGCFSFQVGGVTFPILKPWVHIVLTSANILQDSLVLLGRCEEMWNSVKLNISQTRALSSILLAHPCMGSQW